MFQQLVYDRKLKECIIVNMHIVISVFSRAVTVPDGDGDPLALVGVSGSELSQSPLEGADLQFSDGSGQENVDHSKQEVPADHTHTHTYQPE